MIKLVTFKNICLIGRAEDVFNSIEKLAEKYNTIEEAIVDLQGTSQKPFQQHLKK